MKKKLSLIVFVLAAIFVFGALMTACSTTQGDAKVNEDYKQEEVEENMEELRTSSGFKITYQGDATGEGETGTETFSYGAKGDIYFFSSSEEEIYYDLSAEDHAEIYKKTDGTWTKTVKAYSDSYTKADAKAEISGSANTIIGYTTYYTSFSDTGMKKGTGEILGRACDTYTFGMKAVIVSFDTTFYVDQETGICLKWVVGGKAFGQEGGVNFECKGFDMNPTYTLPEVSEENTTYENAQDANTENGETVTGVEVADAVRKANELRLSAGFKVSYTITGVSDTGSSTSTLTVAAKGDVFYFNDGTVERYVDTVEEETYDVYTKVSEDAWEKETLAYGDGETKASVQAEVMTSLGSSLTLDASIATTAMIKTSDSFLNRDAIKYVEKNRDAITGYGYTVYVDSETSMLLKCEASATIMGKTVSYGVECTEFSTSFSVDLSALNVVEEE